MASNPRPLPSIPVLLAMASLCVIAISILPVSHGWSIEKISTAPSRREALRRIVGVSTFGSVVSQVASPAVAASSLPAPTDLRRLQLGHARVSYLLSNWDAITSVCGSKAMSDNERKQVVRTEGGGGGFCDRDPLKVQEFLGYKSTVDPLFRADKLMVKAAGLVDPDELEGYLDAVERYREKADQGAMMAFTSSWGEANPNGELHISNRHQIISFFATVSPSSLFSCSWRLIPIVNSRGVEPLSSLIFPSPIRPTTRMNNDGMKKRR